MQQHTEVIGGNGQMMRRLSAPEVVHAEQFDPELIPQFLDPVFQVRPAIIAPPHRHGVHPGRQVCAGNQLGLGQPGDQWPVKPQTERVS